MGDLVTSDAWLGANVAKGAEAVSISLERGVIKWEVAKSGEVFHPPSEERIRSRGKRAKPGKGELVNMMLLDPFDPEHPDADKSWQRGEGRTSIHWGCGEDFAECWADIVVKVKAGVNVRDLVQCLRDLVEVLSDR